MKLELTKEQINLILQALAQLPYAQSAGLIQEIINQVQPKEEKKK
jgi:hypothetical protein